MNIQFKSTIDNTGRFVIPKPILKELGWVGISKVNVRVEDAKVIITKDEYARCEICNSLFSNDYTYCPHCGVVLCEEKK